MRNGRVKAETVQLLSNTYFLCIRGSAPSSLEAVEDTSLRDTFFKKLQVIGTKQGREYFRVIVYLFILVVGAINDTLHFLQLFGIKIREQMSQQNASRIYTFVAVRVTIGRPVNTNGYTK